MGNEKSHWEKVYNTKLPEKQSWTQDRPSPSIDWILESLPDRNSTIIDVGGGTSHLVDYLLDAGFKRPAVLDLSSSALAQAKARLGNRASLVEWIEADAITFVPSRKISLWHDRAVFHFLVKAENRQQYVENVKNSLVKGGRIIIATFSPSGPSQCSGLDVVRFDAKGLVAEFGSDFTLVREVRNAHLTPWGATQDFQYCEFQL